MTILADVDIGPKSLKRTLEDIPVVPQPLSAKLSPAKVDITLQGPWPQVKDLKPNEIKAFVETKGLSSGRYRLKVGYEELNLGGSYPAGACYAVRTDVQVTIEAEERTLSLTRRGTRRSGGALFDTRVFVCKPE